MTMKAEHLTTRTHMQTARYHVKLAQEAIQKATNDVDDSDSVGWGLKGTLAEIGYYLDHADEVLTTERLN